MKRGMGLVLSLAGVLIGGVALAHDDGRSDPPGADASGVYHACVDRIGLMRLVGGPSECRRVGETPIAWSLAGPPGAIGPMGAIGPVGPAGAIGAAGPMGAIGAPGLRGADGAQGPVGPGGALGATGAQGPQGIGGPSGPAGLQGPIGFSGSQGIQGLTGPAGPAGALGAAGPVGPAGANGLMGLQGSAGPAGPAGPQGPAGPPGDVPPEGELAAGISDVPGDAYMKVTDANDVAIRGASHETGFVDQFNLQNFGLSIARRDDGSFHWSRFQVQTQFGPGIATLRAAAAAQTVLKSVEINVLRKGVSGTSATVFETITLTNVLVAHSGGTEVVGSDLSNETIAFDFQTIRWSVKSQTGFAVAASWDRATGTPVNNSGSRNLDTVTFDIGTLGASAGGVEVVSLVGNDVGPGNKIGAAAIVMLDVEAPTHLNAFLTQHPISLLTTNTFNASGSLTSTQSYANTRFTRISLGHRLEKVTWEAASTTLSIPIRDGAGNLTRTEAATYP